jgi:hypothetical protein
VAVEGVDAQAHRKPNLAPRRTSEARGATGAARTFIPRLPEPLYEGLREVAFNERRKIHDIVLDGVRLALRKRGWRE